MLITIPHGGAAASCVGAGFQGQGPSTSRRRSGSNHSGRANIFIMRDLRRIEVGSRWKTWVQSAFEAGVNACAQSRMREPVEVAG